MFEWFSAMVSQFGIEVAAVGALAYGTYKFRRFKAIAGVVVGGIGTVATIGAVFIGGLFIATLAGWFDAGAAVSDIAGAAGGAWDAVGRRAVEWALEEVA